MVVTAEQQGTFPKVSVDLNGQGKYSPTTLIDLQKYL